MVTAAYCFFLILVSASSWTDIWQCLVSSSYTLKWWCGDESVTTPCQSGVNAIFLSPTFGSILGFPPVTSSQAAATSTLINTAITIFSSGLSSTTIISSGLDSKQISVSASSRAKATTNPSVPAQTQERSASLPTAIGLGIGVPLGIAVIGFLSFMMWKEAGRQRTSEGHRLIQQPALGKGGQSATAAINQRRTELPDTQLPLELDDTGRRELPNI